MVDAPALIGRKDEGRWGYGSPACVRAAPEVLMREVPGEGWRTVRFIVESWSATARLAVLLLALALAASLFIVVRHLPLIMW